MTRETLTAWCVSTSTSDGMAMEGDAELSVFVDREDHFPHPMIAILWERETEIKGEPDSMAILLTPAQARQLADILSSI